MLQTVCVVIVYTNVNKNSVTENNTVEGQHWTIAIVKRQVISLDIGFVPTIGGVIVYLCVYYNVFKLIFSALSCILRSRRSLAVVARMIQPNDHAEPTNVKR